MHVPLARQGSRHLVPELKTILILGFKVEEGLGLRV